MKKLALVLTMSLISLLGVAQIKTSGIFETGLEQRRTIINLDFETQRNTGLLPLAEFGPFYGYLYMEAELKGFKAYTSNKTYFNKDKEIYFNPQMTEFTIGFSYTHKKITVGFEHLCAHTIEVTTYSEYYNRIYFRAKLF